MKQQLKQVIQKLPGISRIVAQRDQLMREVSQWKANQTYAPGHFYSPIPDQQEIDAIVQRTGDRSQETITGVSLNWSEQEDLFRELAQFYDSIPFADQQQDQGSFRYYFDNPYYLYTDGILLHTLMRKLRPSKIIEVGSGFSSCLMLDTNESFLNSETKLTFIEPYPTRLNDNLRESDQSKVEIVEDVVQNVPLTRFDELGADDILFIDSSHVGKAGSDVNYLFFDVLPRLNPGVWIHVHDVFFPFEYPKSWLKQGRAWNEAYMLRCLLTHSHWLSLRLWGDALCARRKDMVQSLMPKCLKNSGAGIWLQRL